MLKIKNYLRISLHQGCLYPVDNKDSWRRATHEYEPRIQFWQTLEMADLG